MTKYVIIGIVFVVLVLGALYAVTEGIEIPSKSQSQPSTQPVGEFDNQFKNLKIN